VKGEKPPVPTRGLSKRSAGGTDVGEDANDVDEDGQADDGANAAVDLIPRTDIRFTVSAVDIGILMLSPQCLGPVAPNKLKYILS